MNNQPESSSQTQSTPAERRGGSLLYRLSLWLLLVILVAALASCAAGSRENGGDTTGVAVAGNGAADGKPLRLLLGGNESLDSIRLVTDYVVDQVIRQITDSIPQARYLTINNRDSLVSQASEITLADLGDKLDLDGVIYTRTARFGQTLAVEMRVIEPAGGKVLFRDLSFVTIRFRDREGSMLIGPAIYSAVRKSLRAFFALPHSDSSLSATEPLLMSGIEIAADSALGRIATARGRLAEGVAKALSDYAIMHFPEIVPLDPLSRDRLYETLKLGRVESAIAMSDLELKALATVGIEKFMSGSITPSGGDSLRFMLAVHQITARQTDSIIDRQEVVLPRATFAASTMEQEVIVTLIDLAEPLFKREVDRVRNRYTEQIKQRGATR